MDNDLFGCIWPPRMRGGTNQRGRIESKAVFRLQANRLTPAVIRSALVTNVRHSSRVPALKTETHLYKL